MSLIRLADLFHIIRNTSIDKKYLDSVSEFENILFPDRDRDAESNELNGTYKYIPKGRMVQREDIQDYFKYSHRVMLSDYEHLLLKKIITKSAPSLLCVSGHMGSGKSSTLDYIRYIIEKLSGSDPNTSIVLDFNNHRYSSDENEASEEVLEDIVEKLVAALGDLPEYDESEEMTAYWKECFDRMKRNNYRYRSIVGLYNRIKNVKSDIFDNIESIKDEEEKVQRRSILNAAVLTRPNRVLEYYMLLWRYYLKKYYSNQRERLVIYLDNIDNSSPAVQVSFAQILQTYVLSDGPKFVIAVRPETFETIHLDRCSNFMNHIEHTGPPPEKVICYHMRKYTRRKQAYYSGPVSLDTDVHELLNKYFGKVLSLNGTPTTPQYKYISKYIGNLSGDSIRLAMKIAEGFLVIDRRTELRLKNQRLNLYQVSRNLIRSRDEYYSVKSGAGIPYSPICNLFDVIKSNETGRHLVKLRILNYLNSRNVDMKNSVGALREEMYKFGYSETKNVRYALNDMLLIQRQLVRSTDKDGYLSVEEYHASRESELKITCIGKGYLRIYKDLNYIQEVMFDTVVDDHYFQRKYDISPPSERFVVLASFLSYLSVIEKGEIECYMARNMGYEHYVSCHDIMPITYKMMLSAYRSMDTIVMSEKSKHLSEEVMLNYEDALGRIEGAMRSMKLFIQDVFSYNLRWPKRRKSKKRFRS